VLAFYAGKLGEAELLARADRQQRCEANAYLGEEKLSRGDAPAAAQAFESALRDCAPGDIEKALATYELQQAHVQAAKP
jgi:hypothetical protein